VTVATAEVGIQDYVALVNRYLDRGMTDGLPIIPPAGEAVAAMCVAAGLPPDHVVGEFPLRSAPVTVKDIAVNALMAGCLPEYMPVVVAGYEALFLPGFGTSHMTQSAGSFLAWFVLGGPIRHQLGVRSGANAFGPGARANATLGRAFRLGVINLAGSNPNAADRSALGTPYRLTMVHGEDEERSPWPSLAVEHGFGPGDSTLVTMKSTQPILLTLEVTTPEQLLDAILDEWTSLQNYSDGIAIHLDETPGRVPGLQSRGAQGGGGGRALVLLGEEHRALLAGWSKEQVRTYLATGGGKGRRGRTAGEVRSAAFVGWGRFAPDAPDETWAPLNQAPEQILLLAVGGDGPTSMLNKAMSFDIRKLPSIPHSRPPEITTATAIQRNPVQEYVALVNRTMQAGRFDGLPIVPPEPRGIEAMVAATGRHAEDVLGHLVRAVGHGPLGGRPFTVGEVAAMAFVAGCLPEYMPVLTAALEVLLEPRFGMYRVLTDQDGATPWVIVNGPIRERIKLNGWRNVFGPYFRANSSLGRALNLCLRNIGGVQQGIGLGTAFAYTGGVFAEFEEESPWAPLHTEFGFQARDSTVTVLDCSHPVVVSQPEAAGPEPLLRTLADQHSTVQRYADRTLRPGFAVALPADPRIHLKHSGWTRRQCQEFLAQTIGRTAGELRERGFGERLPSEAPADFRVPLIARPEDVLLFAAGSGGPLGGMAVSARYLGTRQIPD
jgi:hypothetical protein